MIRKPVVLKDATAHGGRISRACPSIKAGPTPRSSRPAWSARSGRCRRPLLTRAASRRSRRGQPAGGRRPAATRPDRPGCAPSGRRSGRPDRISAPSMPGISRAKAASNRRDGRSAPPPSSAPARRSRAMRQAWAASASSCAGAAAPRGGRQASRLRKPGSDGPSSETADSSTMAWRWRRSVSAAVPAASARVGGRAVELAQGRSDQFQHLFSAHDLHPQLTGMEGAGAEFGAAGAGIGFGAATGVSWVSGRDARIRLASTSGDSPMTGAEAGLDAAGAGIGFGAAGSGWAPPEPDSARRPRGLRQRPRCPDPAQIDIRRQPGARLQRRRRHRFALADGVDQAGDRRRSGRSDH